LYRRVLARYVQLATAEGVTQAMFPEGGLSRDGALRPPKFGLLSYMVARFDPDGERDVVFVPVGINYDRLLEDRNLTASAASGARRRLAAAGEWPRVGANRHRVRGTGAGRASSSARRPCARAARRHELRRARRSAHARVAPRRRSEQRKVFGQSARDGAAALLC